MGQGNWVPAMTMFSVSLDSFFLAFSLCRIGGALPIVFAYFSEFLSREKRGEHLSWLGMFWMTGGIYASAMAWSIIPHYGENVGLKEPRDLVTMTPISEQHFLPSALFPHSHSSRVGP